MRLKERFEEDQRGEIQERFEGDERGKRRGRKMGSAKIETLSKKIYIYSIRLRLNRTLFCQTHEPNRIAQFKKTVTQPKPSIYPTQSNPYNLG